MAAFSTAEQMIEQFHSVTALVALVMIILSPIIGWLISRAAGLVFPTPVPLWAAVAGVGASVGVGLFFGIWPANRAARLDPVDALRYEWRLPAM